MKLTQNCIHLVQLNGSMLNASNCNNVNFGLYINKYATGIDMNINDNNTMNSHRLGINKLINSIH